MTEEEADIITTAYRIAVSADFVKLMIYCKRQKNCNHCVLDQIMLCRLLGAPWLTAGYVAHVNRAQQLLNINTQNQEELKQRIKKRKQKKLETYFKKP